MVEAEYQNAEKLLLSMLGETILLLRTRQENLCYYRQLFIWQN